MEEYKNHFASVSSERYENDFNNILDALEKTPDKRNDEIAIALNDNLNLPISVEELKETIRIIRESAPGKDGIRICYIKNAHHEIKEIINKKITDMFNNEDEEWEEEIKTGQVVPLFKKGDKNNVKIIEASVCCQWVAEF